MRVLFSILVAAVLLVSGCQAAKGGFGYGEFSRTNGAYVDLPTTVKEAKEAGWVVPDEKQACVPAMGFEYVYVNQTATTATSGARDPSTPLSLFFRAYDGAITGLAVRAWFPEGEFNPDSWRRPVVGADNDDTQRWITVSFRDPSLACQDQGPLDQNLLGDRVLVNPDVGECNYFKNVKVPLEAPLGSDQWISGACMPNMARHWLYPLQGNVTQLLGYDHGENVLPVVPMYSEDKNAQDITALAFITTTPQVTQRDGGFWDATGTCEQLVAGNVCVEEGDPCLYGPANSVFHVYFIDPTVSSAQCPHGRCPNDPPSLR